MSGFDTYRARPLTASGKVDKSEGTYASPHKRTKSYLNCNDIEDSPSNQTQSIRRKSGSIILEDGWIMGPLGLPVRETLEVGHRGTQKAFNQKSPSHQRTSERSEVNNDLNSQFPDQEHESNLDEVASAAIYHRRRSVFDAEVTDEKKEQKAKQMQLEQNRALEQQIRDKAAKAAAEKEKMDREEAQEAARWEAERVAIMKEYEREQEEAKEKMEEDFRIAERRYEEESRLNELRCAEEAIIAKEAEDRMEAIRAQDRVWEAERDEQEKKENEEREEKEKEKELLRLEEEIIRRKEEEKEAEKEKVLEKERAKVKEKEQINLQKIEISKQEDKKEQKTKSSIWSSLFQCFAKSR